MGDASISLPHKDKQNCTNIEAGKDTSFLEEEIEPDSVVDQKKKKKSKSVCIVRCANRLSIFNSQRQIQVEITQ